MSDQNREVTVTVGAKLRAGPDPFKQMADQASGAERTISGRLERIQERLKEAGTLRGFAKDQLVEAFGISKLDRELTRSSTKIQDNLSKLERQATNIKLDGNPAPMLATLRRVEADAMRVQRVVEGTGRASIESFGRAGGGVMEVARGMTLMSGGNADMEKMIHNLLMVQATIDILRGSKEIFVGLVGGIANMSKALDALGTASSIQKGIQVATEATAGAVLKEAGAQGVATTVTAEASLATKEATAANLELAKSHIAVAEAAEARAGAEAQAAAGSMAGGGGGIGGAVGGGFRMGGLTLGLLGAGVGAGIGAGIGGATGGKTWSNAAIGAGVGGVLAPAMLIGSGALGTVGAGLAGLGAAAAGLMPESGREWLAKNTRHTFLAPLMGSSELGARTDQEMRKEKMAEALAAQPDQDTFAWNMLQTQRHRKVMQQFGSLLPEEEERRMKRYSLDREREDRERGIRESTGAFQTETSLYGIEDRRYGEDVARAKQQEQSREAMSRSLDLRHFGAGGMQTAITEMGAVDRLALTGSKGTAQSEAGVLKAEQELIRAKEEEERIQDRIRKANDSDGSSLNEKLALQQELLEAQQRSYEAQQNQVRAEREHAAAERQRLENLRQLAQEQEAFYRNQRKQLENQKQDQLAKLGLMAPGEQEGLIRASKALDQALAGGGMSRQSPGLMFVNGRPVVNPGQPGGITLDQIRQLEGSGLAGDRLQKLGLMNAQANPALAELLKETQARIDAAKAGETNRHGAEVKLSQQIALQVHTDAANVADHAGEAVREAIKKSMDEIERHFEGRTRQIARDEIANSWRSTP